MSMSLRALSARSVGQFPLSIPTSLALEGLLGVYPDRVANEQKNYVAASHRAIDELWINVRTLYRNVMGSLDKDQPKADISPKDVFSVIYEEMMVIEGIVAEASGETVAVRFYHCEFKNLQRDFPRADLYTPRTAIQIFDRHHEDETMARLLLDEQTKARIGITNWKVSPSIWQLSPKRVALLTHYPTDLLHKFEFTELLLLESRTGVVKGQSKFYTKLKNAPDGVKLPFNIFTLQIYGDNGRIFDSNNRKIREAVSKLAVSDGWTFATTRDRIVASVKKHPDKPLVDVLLAMIRN